VVDHFRAVRLPRPGPPAARRRSTGWVVTMTRDR